MRTNPRMFLAAGACSMLISCAFITVYVYFPEKDVKKAFKNLDDKYLGQEADTAPPPGGTPPSENASQPAPPSSAPTEPSRP